MATVLKHFEDLFKKYTNDSNNCVTIQFYKPQKYDHIARPLGKTKWGFVKHHGIILEPNEANPMESKIFHFSGDDSASALIIEDTLKNFMEDHTHLYVYDHAGEMIPESEIISNIEKKKQDRSKYDLFNNNCEDLVCEILLKKNHTYTKQYSSSTVGGMLTKLIIMYTKYRTNTLTRASLEKFDDCSIDSNKKIVYRVRETDEINFMSLGQEALYFLT